MSRRRRPLQYHEARTFQILDGSLRHDLSAFVDALAALKAQRERKRGRLIEN
jgi:hypothetical protein